MDEKAFWIGPDGTIYPVTRSHIASVIADPARFGLTKDYIEGLYKTYKEPIGWEGLAREHVVKELIARGWIRIRDYGDYLSVQVFSLDKHNTAARLLTFFLSIAGGYSPEMEVRLGLLAEKTTKTMTLAEIGQELAAMCSGE